MHRLQKTFPQSGPITRSIYVWPQPEANYKRGTLLGAIKTSIPYLGGKETIEEINQEVDVRNWGVWASHGCESDNNEKRQGLWDYNDDLQDQGLIS